MWRPTQYFAASFTLFCIVSLTSGCGSANKPEPASGGTNEGETDTAAPSDLPAAVEALQQASAKMKKGAGESVTEIDLRGCDDQVALLDHLAGLPSLRRVVIDDPNFGDEHVPTLVALPNLVSAYLSKTSVSDEGVTALATIEGIQHLDLSLCPITAEAIDQIATMKNLRLLRLNGSIDTDTPVSDDSMAKLAGLDQLKVLSIATAWVSPTGLESISGLHGLEEINLKGTMCDDTASVELLVQFPRLRKLGLASTSIGDDQLEVLLQSESLRELDLSECANLTDFGMETIGQMTNLERLNLWRVAISDDGVAYLAELTNLKWLNLDNIASFTDEGTAHLTGLTKMETLHLGTTAVTDAGLENLRGMSNLRMLGVTRTSVTDEGAAHLQEHLPQLTVDLLSN